MEQRELLERRAGLVNQARALVDLAEGEDRGLSDEETVSYDALMSDALDLGERSDRIGQQEKLAAEMAKSVNEPVKPDPGDDSPEARTAQWQEETRVQVGQFLRNWEGGTGALELRALMSASDIYGGYLVTPVKKIQRPLIESTNGVSYESGFGQKWA